MTLIVTLPSLDTSKVLIIVWLVAPVLLVLEVELVELVVFVIIVEMGFTGRVALLELKTRMNPS